MSSSRKWQTPVVVASLHVAVILMAFFLRDSEPPDGPPVGVKVTLAQIPNASGKPTSVPPADKRPLDKRPSRPPSTKTWRMRTPEEIRKGLTIEDVNQQKQAPTRDSQAPDLNSLVDSFKKETHATSRIGEPVAISDSYAATVQEILYNSWKQPTRAEVPVSNQAVNIRLEIERDGRLSAKHITQRSKSLVMNQSVKAMLHSLPSLPPLPDDYTGNQLRLDITLRLQ